MVFKHKPDQDEQISGLGFSLHHKVPSHVGVVAKDGSMTRSARQLGDRMGSLARHWMLFRTNLSTGLVTREATEVVAQQRKGMHYTCMCMCTRMANLEIVRIVQPESEVNLEIVSTVKRHHVLM